MMFLGTVQFGKPKLLGTFANQVECLLLAILFFVKPWYGVGSLATELRTYQTTELPNYLPNPSHTLLQASRSHECQRELGRLKRASGGSTEDG